jgi:signal transduction histidine kinase
MPESERPGAKLPPRDEGDGGAEPAARRGRRSRGSDSGELQVARRRVAELEAELASAQTTIGALLDKADRDREDDAGAGDPVVRAHSRALAESEAQLRRKNAELERSSTMKAEFISIAAHELRTPLTSIVGYLDLLMEGRFGDVSEQMARPMASLRRNAHRLRRLVDEMLDVSRIDAGKIGLRRTACSLAGIVEGVVAELAPLAAAKRQALTVDLQPAPPIDADEDKIHQIASNLLSNAIRYTPEAGAITVFVDRAPQERYAGAWARLRVRDSGIGIPADQRHRIFEPFSDVNPAKHHTSSGPDSAGLGLYIARGLVELHGGLITVESEPGHYTEFTVLLPLVAT